MEIENRSITDWKELEKFRDFLETAPLYKKVSFSLPQGFHKMIPSRLNLYCASDKSEQAFRDAGTKDDPRVQDEAKAEKETERIRRINAQAVQPGRRTSSSGPIVPAPDGIYVLSYRCSACQITMFACWVEVNRGGSWIQKVGQYPAWEISVSRDIEKKLGENDTILLKHALACLRISYGIGACIYLRRLLENQINTLLGIHLEIRISEQATTEELDYIREIINTKSAEDKIKLIKKTAAAAIPTFASNPVSVTYAKLSDGLHNKSDTECVDIAQAAHGVLIRLLVDLKKEQKKQREYKTNIEKLSKL